MLIDDISYAYSGNNSVLTSVQEQTGLPEGLAASSHYSYDLNGNLIGDTGKGITQIDYNLLNLPVKVTGQGGGILEFEYTFGGEKIRKNNEHEREYLGGLEYKNNVLELIHFPNGRIDKTGTVDTFQYYLTDHLGNIVVLFQDTDGDGAIALEEETNGAMDEVIQRNYYYSFGLRVDSPDFQIGDEPKNRYLYNGMENCEELDLNIYLTFFRSYDPSIGRWWQVDPKYNTSQSVYSGMGNNPILFSDQLGDTTRVYGMDGSFVGSIDDTRPNEEHFIADEKIGIISHLLVEHESGKFDAEFTANGVRKNSVAYIGAKTRSDLKNLAQVGEEDGVEAYGVAVISDSREIRVIDKSGELNIKRGAYPGSCENCRSEDFVTATAERAMKDINLPIIFDVHTHGLYSVKAKSETLSASASTLLTASKADYQGTNLQAHLKFSHSVISTTSGYRIYSTEYNTKTWKLVNTGQTYRY